MLGIREQLLRECINCRHIINIIIIISPREIPESAIRIGMPSAWVYMEIYEDGRELAFLCIDDFFPPFFFSYLDISFGIRMP